MNIGLYQGAAALSGLEQWQQSISNNIAASSVAGYKKTDISFEGLAAGKIVNSLNNNSPVTLDAEIPEARGSINFQQGQVIQTGNPLDAAIEGEGFFELETEDGKIIYTRNGQFHLNNDNTLTNSLGYAVQGSGGSIQLILGRGEIGIDKTGKILQGGVPVGQLSIIRFEEPQKLQRVSGGFTAGEESARPEQMDEPRVLQGFIEGSNVSPIREMVNLVAVSRAYEARQKVIQQFDQQMGSAIRILGETR